MPSSSFSRLSIAQPFPFLDLPLEMRREIYRSIFTISTFRLKEQMQPQRRISEDWLPSPSTTYKAVMGTEHGDIVLDATRYLRSTSNYVLGQDPPIHLVALFMTCHQVYDEAVPLFYQEAHFHWSIRAHLPVSLNSLKAHLPKMRHLSIDFSYLLLSFEGRRGHHEVREENVDMEIAATIKYVSDNCLALRSFTLHLLSDFSSHNDSVDFIHESIQTVHYRTKHTEEALKKLKVRDTISIVAVAPTHGYRHLRNAIAPIKDWEMLELHRWPGISITDEQNEGVEDLLQGDRARAIRIWYYQPGGS